MSGEPKTRVMTLEEAVEALYSYGMELRAESLTGEGVSWSVFEFSTELGRPVLVCNGHGTWWEAVSDALGVPVVARDEAAELREENKRLSALVDELLLAPNPLDDENMRLRAEAAELRAAVMGWAKATKRAHEVYSSWVLGRSNEEGEFVYTTGDVVLAQKAKEEAEEYLYTLAATEASES